MTCWTAIPPLGNPEAYFKAIQRFPMLTHEEEIEFGNNPTDENRGKLILSHLRLASSIARLYMYFGIPFEDIMQEANMGLIRAVDRFSPDKGRLSTFATSYIRAQINEYVLKNARMMTLAKSKPHRKLYFNLASAKRELLNGSVSTTLSIDQIDAIATAFNVSHADVVEMDKRLSTFEISLYDRAQTNSDEGYLIQEQIPDLRFEPLAVLSGIEREWFQTAGVEEALDCLDDRSRAVIEGRYMKEKTLTLQELGVIFGVSTERIRQIEVAALKKMRTALAAYAI